MVKVRKNLNVSLQSKQFNQSVNQVLHDWETAGLNLSTEGCRAILLADKIAKSPTLMRVISTYELVEKMGMLDGSGIDVESTISRLIEFNQDFLTKTAESMTITPKANVVQSPESVEQVAQTAKTEVVIPEPSAKVAEQVVVPPVQNHQSVPPVVEQSSPTPVPEVADSFEYDEEIDESRFNMFDVN